ncbi:hypothetical protein BDZ89DRAFT_1067639 [Hymenopellis radicata]|nr:hypothetical protein BDZ89DRAFT_1067639 [Hymenopellis radicata]
MPIIALPADIFLCIFRFLNIADILRFRQVCRPLHDLARLKSVWHMLLRTQILARDIPFPSASADWLESLSSRELERLVRRAIRVRRNWTTAAPRATRQVEIQTSDITRSPAQQRAIKELKLLHRGSHPYLLSATINVQTGTQHPLLVIECWDIQRVPFCIARKHGPWAGSVLFNADPSFPPSVAIQGFNDVQILSLSTVAHSFNSTFTPVARLPVSVGRLISFSGRVIIALESDGRLFMYDSNRAHHRMELLSPSLPPLNAHFVHPSQQSDACYEAIITDEYLVLLRARYIAFYALRTFRRGPATMHGALHPAVYHVWQTPIDSGRIAHRVSYNATRARTEPPLNIVVRFASAYPWPTNMLNHYILHPNPDYLPHLGVSTDNAPYELGPTHLQTLSAPLRLFSQTDLVIGEYSTCVWLDSHTEAYFQQSATGQRLAGRVLKERYSTSSTSSVASVLNVHDTDTWHQLAIDERHSRIAIGAQDGRVTVMDYA